MGSHRHQALALLLLSLFPRTLVSSLHRCGQDICPPGGNGTAAVTGGTYYNIAMVTRKLSGVLLLLLLLALGYSLQRLLCSRRGRLARGRHGHAPVTTSRDPLMEGSSPAPQVPPYHGAKRLPTYEETMRDGTGAAGANGTRTPVRPAQGVPRRPARIWPA